MIFAIGNNFYLKNTKYWHFHKKYIRQVKSTGYKLVVKYEFPNCINTFSLKYIRNIELSSVKNICGR